MPLRTHTLSLPEFGVWMGCENLGRNFLSGVTLWTELWRTNVQSQPPPEPVLKNSVWRFTYAKGLVNSHHSGLLGFPYQCCQALTRWSLRQWVWPTAGFLPMWFSLSAKVLSVQLQDLWFLPGGFHIKLFWWRSYGMLAYQTDSGTANHRQSTAIPWAKQNALAQWLLLKPEALLHVTSLPLKLHTLPSLPYSNSL